MIYACFDICIMQKKRMLCFRYCSYIFVLYSLEIAISLSVFPLLARFFGCFLACFGIFSLFILVSFWLFYLFFLIRFAIFSPLILVSF